MVSQWQKDYEKEAKGIIKNSVKEYEENIRRIRIVEQRLCEVGMHNTQNKLRFCRYCKRSFCKEHGDIKEGVCFDCEKRDF